MVDAEEYIDDMIEHYEESRNHEMNLSRKKEGHNNQMAAYYNGKIDALKEVKERL